MVSMKQVRKERKKRQRKSNTPPKDTIHRTLLDQRQPTSTCSLANNGRFNPFERPFAREQLVTRKEMMICINARHGCRTPQSLEIYPTHRMPNATRGWRRRSLTRSSNCNDDIQMKQDPAPQLVPGSPDVSLPVRSLYAEWFEEQHVATRATFIVSQGTKTIDRPFECGCCGNRYVSVHKIKANANKMFREHNTTHKEWMRQSSGTSVKVQIDKKTRKPPSSTPPLPNATPMSLGPTQS